MNNPLDNAPCGFLSFGDDGTIHTANATLLDMLGRARGEVEGRHFQDILSVGARIFHQTHFFPLLKLHGKAEEIYLSLRAKSGEEIPVLVNARRTERDGLAANDCVLMRMRERARFEEELLKARNAAQKASQAKDDFLAALSHELRTPLSPVLMTATAMEHDPALSAEAREQAGVIRRNAELEARLIDDLLDVTRISHGKLSLVLGPVDIHTLLSQTDEIVRSEFTGKRVSVRFVKEAKAHHVHGDSARLQQVFWNVIKNSVKFTPSGGQVRIVTSNRASEGEPTRLVIRITDTGVGIPPEMLPLIFNAFEQGGMATQRRFGGLGLGLAITRSIVEMHGGAIWAESAGRDQGATFNIELNTIPAPQPGTEPGARSLRVSGTGKLRILFVEDHDSTRDVLSRILRRSGHEVHVAGSGSEALDILASAGRFDVLISDIGLPDQSGFDLMRAVKARQPIPGIALSGYGMEEDIKNAHAAGFNAHLVKPINFEQLRGLLEQVAAGTLS